MYCYKYIYIIVVDCVNERNNISFASLLDLSNVDGDLHIHIDNQVPVDLQSLSHINTFRDAPDYPYPVG